ncbi:alkyl sulfatase dimerization domain-containing protein [Pontiella sulfatireligans]|uniref:Alkyl/aryl-sulfatase YjcS n=1 Tax=Pontiella sulfatireligans TaxID=2750658 RepID=A0A6C2UQU2_9BACT|nr:alkyl sulfatase dimerization domain-containing protein [Pontiella sulfatireligans]SPS74520.1 sulfatase S3 [Kiritimatiellales bacterium]VGO22588.1 Putative alkyl/aryl-sulfatase YjcS [Pontiella sulfatireligans]
MKTILTATALCIIASISGAETSETAVLKKRTAEFRKDVVQVAGNVYTATGYSVQPVSMIVGDDGLVIVDTGLDTISAQGVLAEFRKITALPIKAIILTHGHGDHTGGLPVFAAEGSPDIWARGNFGDEGHAFESAGLTINRKRGARQGGFLLPPEKRINNGVAQAYYPKRGGAVFGADKSVQPNKHLTEARKTIEYAGIKIDLVSLNGETKDALYVWYPEQRVLFSGDNFYKSWPNLYPIRGSAYRDVQAWADSVDQMLQENPDKLVPGHTRPILEKKLVTEMLTNYRDAIRFVFKKTIEGMNQGMTPDELVDYVKLPRKYSKKDSLKEYYGNVEWAVRSIFAGTLGWFDGNPTTLFSLPVKGESERMAALAGGQDKLELVACQALEKQDFQWAAQLCDHLISLDPKTAAPKLMKAVALEGLAENLLTATGRNYYLTCAQELRKEAGPESKAMMPAKTDEKSEANKKAALDFFQLIMGDRDYEAARQYVGEYEQHDPRIGDGYNALVEALETLPPWKDRPQTKIDFKNVAADGNLVYFQTHKEIKALDDGSPARRIVVHVFRFNDDGKIDEHWTVAHSVKLKDCVNKHPLF